MSEYIFHPTAILLLTDRFMKISSYSGYRLLCEDPDGALIFMGYREHPLAIGEAVNIALDCSKIISIDDLKNFDKDVHEYQKTANAKIAETYGYRRESDIYTKAASCDIERRENSIIIQPQHHVRGNAWEPTHRGEADHVVIPSDSKPEEIGKAVWLALSRCTGRRPDILDSINLDELSS